MKMQIKIYANTVVFILWSFSSSSMCAVERKVLKIKLWKLHKLFHCEMLTRIMRYVRELKNSLRKSKLQIFLKLSSLISHQMHKSSYVNGEEFLRDKDEKIRGGTELYVEKLGKELETKIIQETGDKKSRKSINKKILSCP